MIDWFWSLIRKKTSKKECLFCSKVIEEGEDYSTIVYEYEKGQKSEVYICGECSKEFGLKNE